MKKLLLVLAAILGLVVGTAAYVSAEEAPQTHTLPACTNGATVWMEYRADTYTDDGGHTYGPATTLTCDPDGDNTVHIKWLPSTWTLAQGHTYCADSGSAYMITRLGGNANVCPDVAI